MAASAAAGTLPPRNKSYAAYPSSARHAAFGSL